MAFVPMHVRHAPVRFAPGAEEVPIAPSVVATVSPASAPAPAPAPTAAEIEDRVARAFADGAALGRSEADEARAERDSRVADVAALVEEFAAARRRVTEDAIGDIAQIVDRFCRRIVGEHLRVDEVAVANIARAAVDRLPSRDHVIVRVGPEVSAFVRHALSGLAEVIEDTRIDGGCRVEAGAASIDATLAAVEEGLDEALAAWRSDE